MKKKILIALGIIVFITLMTLTPISPTVLGEDKDLVFLSTIKARSMAMGGAYMGVSYKTESMLWNPAGIQIPPHADKSGRFHSNLLAAPFVVTGIFSYMTASAIEGDDEDEYGNEYPTPMTDRATESLYAALPFFFKSASIRNESGTVALAGNLVEDILPYETLDKRKRGRQDMDMFDNLGYQFGMRGRISTQFSVGATLGFYNLYEDNEHPFGNTLTVGTMYCPSEKLSLGLGYFNYSPGAKDVLLPLERITEKSVNLGLSFRPDLDTEITFDMRNLLNDEAEAYGERHIGAERRLARWFALRGGYYKQNNNGADIASLGFQCKSFNYTLIENLEDDTRYHLVQVMATLKF
jgi:hypothetical protein